MGGESGVRRGRGVFRALAGNRALVRVVAAYALFILTENSVWIAMLIFAYSRGGATIAGLVALAQLLPAAVLAPIFAAIADRRSPVTLLAGGYLVQAAGMAVTAVAVAAGIPLLAYAAAVVASTAVATTRPAQSTLIPALSVTPDQLTAANVVVGWVEAAAITLAGLLTGGVIALGGLAVDFAACAGLGAVALALVRTLRVATLAGPPQGESSPVLAGLGEGIQLVAREPRLRHMVTLLTAEAVLVGSLDLLFVILAVTTLDRPQAWAGYLNAAYGVGAVVAALAGVLLVGRRLGKPILAAALLLSCALAALTAPVGVTGTVALLMLVGAGRAVLDVAARTLLQRSVRAEVIGRVFGLLEGLTMAGIAAGSLLVPALVYLGGGRLALVGVAAVLPLGAVVGGKGLFRLDAGTRVPVVEIGLLRAIPLFAELPAPAIEGLAAALTHADVPAGTVLLRQGDQGDAYFVIAAGLLDVTQDGRFLRTCARGEGVGEIALLRAIPRTATVTARTDATVYRLGREPFLTAVLGHAGTQAHAEDITDALLAADAAASGAGGQGKGTAGRE